MQNNYMKHSHISALLTPGISQLTLNTYNSHPRTPHTAHFTPHPSTPNSSVNKESDGQAVLYASANGGHTDVVNVLLAAGADVDQVGCHLK